MGYIIGNKSSFAIEFDVQHERYSNHLFGWIRIWLGGGYIGAYDNLCILSATSYELESFSRMNLDTDEFDGMSDEAIYRHIKLDDCPGFGKYWFSPGGDSFDDFSVVVYCNKNKYKFIWKLHENTFFEYAGYPKGFLCADVSVEEFKRVVSNFIEQLDQLKNVIPVLDSP
jgi:hypothetical protein